MPNPTWPEVNGTAASRSGREGAARVASSHRRTPIRTRWSASRGRNPYETSSATSRDAVATRSPVRREISETVSAGSSGANASKIRTARARTDSLFGVLTWPSSDLFLAGQTGSGDHAAARFAEAVGERPGPYPAALLRRHHVTAEVITCNGLADGAEHVALAPGDPSAATPLVRLHSECLTGDVFGSARATAGPSCARPRRQSPPPKESCSSCVRKSAASASTTSSVPMPRRTRAWTPTRPTWPSAWPADPRNDQPSAAPGLPPGK